MEHSNALAADNSTEWTGGARNLAPVYIFYGFESAGDISEETKDAGRQVPRAMRHALVWGGVASFIVIAALLLSVPSKGGFAGVIGSTLGMVAPTGLSSPRGYFNLDWITLIAMIVVFIAGLILFALARGGKEIDAHLRDDAEKPAAAR